MNKHEQKLRKLKVLTKFKKNLKKNKKNYNNYLKDHKTWSFCSFIEDSFIWAYSPEGYAFWKNILKK